MAFQQTSASSQDDVIQQTINFAISNAGFSDAGSVTVPGADSTGLSNGRTLFRCSKLGFTWGFCRVRGGTNPRPNFGFYMQFGDNSNIERPEGDVLSTPRTPCRVSCYDFSGPFSNVYLYTDGVSVFCCIELAQGIYTHFGFGSIVKTENFVGGEFIAGMDLENTPGHPYSIWSASFANPMFPGSRVTNRPSQTNFHSASPFPSYVKSIPISGVDTGFSRFASFSKVRDNNVASGEAMNGISHDWVHSSYDSSSNIRASSHNQRSPLWPNIIRLDHQTNDLFRVSGHTPILHYCFMDFLEPGSLLGQYQVFPYSQKNGDSVLCPNSGGLGIAYKRT